MLNLEQVSVEFGGNWLMHDVSYQFLPGDRIGLIGRNGAGKSTLLKIIAGEMIPTLGRVNKSNDLKIGYFHQELLSFQTEKSIFELAREAFEPILKLKADIDHILERIEQGDTDLELWDELSEKQTTLEALGGDAVDAQVYSVLSGLGFDSAEHNKPFHTFSGGWRMRVLLARMLLSQPDVLMLDEPTNHLDLPSIQWLENYLKTFRGTCLVVSHDRFFLDRIAEKILELSLRRLHVYAGNYSFYRQEKAMRMELHQRAYENQQKFIEEQEDFINRFRAKATKARQVQSRIKQLDKVDLIEAPEEESFGLNIRFRVKANSGKEVLTINNVSKAYGEKVILDRTEAGVYRGDKIALIGANGVGKSTVLRILADKDNYLGERKEGYQVVSSFYAQHQLESLNLSRDIFEEIQYHAADRTDQEIRTTLGCFMFSGEEIFKKIKVLSGGEKSRVALTKVLLSEANFLLLDEPTNHLDIPSIQILIEALKSYEGTFIVVSHDRYFLKEIANKIWYIEDKKIKEYIGTYDEYEEWKAKQLAEAAPIVSVPKPVAPVPTPKATQAEAEEAAKRQKQNRNRIKKLEADQGLIEAELGKMERALHDLGVEMADPKVAANFALLKQKQKDYDALQAKIQDATRKWEAIVMEIEGLS